MEYKVLTDIPVETMHKAMLEGFSDYEFSMDIPLEKFKTFLKRRDFAPSLSIGAFDSDKLVGFIITGIRGDNAYDCSTAVIPDYRSQGIGKKMFTELKNHLLDSGIKKYYLEVLQNNKSAVELYKKMGFQTTREFHCIRVNKDDLKEVVDGNQLQIRSMDEIDNYRDILDTEASWQNDISGLIKVEDNFNLVVNKGDTPNFFAIIHKVSGDLSQLWYNLPVDELKQRISELFNYTEKESISIVNIDKENKEKLETLNNTGFKEFTKQYEMVLDL